MRTKQLNNNHRATGNGLARTCDLGVLKAFQDNYKKSNADCDYRGEAEVFWIDGDKRLDLKTFMNAYLIDMIKSDTNAKNGYYEFTVSDAKLFKTYLDAAKQIDTTTVPTSTAVAGGELYAANSYWNIKVPFSKQMQQELLDGAETDLQIKELERERSEAQAQQAEAELATYTAKEQLKTKQNTKWIGMAIVALAIIVILKRNRK